MKKFSLQNCLMICMLMFSTFSYTQNVQFAYDAHGNRISSITVIRESKSALTDSILLNYSGENLNQNIENLQITVFPNPTFDIVHIQCEGLEKSMSVNLYLFSGKGDMLREITLSDINQTIDLTNYASGIYYLKLQISDKIQSWKIVKQ